MHNIFPGDTIFLIPASTPELIFLQAFSVTQRKNHQHCILSVRKSHNEMPVRSFCCYALTVVWILSLQVGDSCWTHSSGLLWKTGHGVGAKRKINQSIYEVLSLLSFSDFFFFLNQPEHLQAACHISLIATFLFIFPPLSTAACASVAKFLLTPRPAAAASPQLRWGQRCNICAVIREITQCNFTVQQNRLIACMHCVCVP